MFYKVVCFFLFVFLAFMPLFNSTHSRDRQERGGRERGEGMQEPLHGAAALPAVPLAAPCFTKLMLALNS